MNTCPYCCAYCGVELRFNKMRRVPDDFCQRCYHALKEYRGDIGGDSSTPRETAPWLKFLMTKERSRRIKLLRYRKRGIDYLPVSFEDYLEHPEIIQEESGEEDQEW